MIAYIKKHWLAGVLLLFGIGLLILSLLHLPSRDAAPTAPPSSSTAANQPTGSGTHPTAPPADPHTHHWVDATCDAPKTCTLCGATEGGVRIHSYDRTVTLPDCANEGYTTYTCKHCGNSYTAEHLAPLAHSWGEGVVKTPATEEAEGLLVFTCNHCNEEMAQVIPRLEHAHHYISAVTEPTCDTEGYTTHTCRCGDSYITGKLPSLSHSWNDGVVESPATEETEGLMIFTCTRCEAEKSQIIPSLGHIHSYIPVVTDPTCTSDGYTTHACRCGDSYITDTIPALDHSWDTGVVQTPATEEAEGLLRFTCARCQEAKTEVIPKLEHIHSYTPTVTAPTCTSDGYTTHTCRCGDSYITDKITPLDHNWDIGVVQTPATEETEGLLRFTCQHCGAVKTQAIPTLAHTHSYMPSVTAPTCTSDGYTTHICRCGDSYITDQISALDHSWDAGVIQIPATEEQTGLLRFTCARCQEAKTEIIPKLEHIHSYIPTVTAPTCTVDGYTTHTCRCGHSYITDETSALTHDWDNGVIQTPATEEQTGLLRFTCARCQEAKTEIIPKLEHIHSYTPTVTAPTCTSDGYTTHTCRCGHSYITDPLAPLEHSWDTGIVQTPATEEQTGLMRFTCSRCQEAKTEIIPKLEHIHSYTPTVTAPTCTSDGYTTHTCRCGHSYITDQTAILGHNWLEATLSAPKTCNRCGLTEGSPLPPILKPATITLLRPVASGVLVKSNKNATIDYSNTKDGYVMVQYLVSTEKQLMVQVFGPTTTYTYMIEPQEWTVFPLSDGNGDYTVKVYQNVDGDRYSVKLTLSLTVTLEDEFAPFLRPNQYVNYENATNTMNQAASLLTDEMGVLEKVAIIYNFVSSTISYDYDKIDLLQAGYLPDLDQVLAEKKGICFDYAALMTAMLRTQNIPCKLVIGYANGGYHAWISVWSPETGWIDGAIYFTGTDWHLLDPTFAAGGADITKVTYVWKYIY